MKATELRIGNIIDINNKIISVTIEDINRINYNTIPGYSPIPLTEEILLKVGFEKIDIGIVLNIKNMQIGLIAMRGKWNLGISGPFGLVQPRYIEFLHELQNIAHSLTGQELNTAGLLK